jgi:hypothetical protein
MVGFALVWFVNVQSTAPPGAIVMLAVALMLVDALVVVPVAVHDSLLRAQPLGAGDSVTV